MGLGILLISMIVSWGNILLTPGAAPVYSARAREIVLGEADEEIELKTDTSSYLKVEVVGSIGRQAM
jgi:hypothetical protein